MDRRRIRMWSRMGLYVTAACFAYMAVWLAWMVGEQVDTARGTIHVLVALVVAMVVGSPAAYALAMLPRRPADGRKEKDT